MYIIFTVQYIAYGRCTMEINYLHFRLSPAVIGYVEEKTPTIHFLLVSYMIKYANPKKKTEIPNASIFETINRYFFWLFVNISGTTIATLFT